MPLSARTSLRLVKLSSSDLIGSIIEWVWSKDSPDAIFSQVREEIPDFDEADLMERIGELSDTVAALTGLNLVDEVYSALSEQEGDEIPPEDFEPPSYESGDYLETVSESNVQSGFSRGKVEEDEGSGDWWEYVTQPGACEICAPLDGIQAAQDDAIWADRIPPLHPRCVCDLRAIAPQKVRATDEDVPNEARGAKDWGDPRKTFDPDLSDKPAALRPIYEEHLRNLRRNQ